MKHLKLPVLKEKGRKEKHTSMDDYLRFVIGNLRYTVDIDSARRLKRKLFAGAPFILK